MKEIKFRVYYPSNSVKDCGIVLKERMEYCDTIQMLNSAITQDRVNLITRPFMLMQYTGLKDKNGKEIYEGDIIERLHNGEFIWKGNVYYDEKYGRYDVRINGEINFCVCDYTDREVKGNVYENPELLPS